MRASVVTLALVVGCGGRVEPDRAPSADSGLDAVEDSAASDGALDEGGESSDVPGDAADDPCVLGDGTALCGVCGKTCTTTGIGACAHFVSGDGTALCGVCGKTCTTTGIGACARFVSDDAFATYGMCIEDFPATKAGVAMECSVCPSADDLCAFAAASGNLLCVQRAACERLARDGLASACRFQDKSRWSPTAAPPTAPCPAAAASLGLCGGACASSCADGEVCTGRSPLHPFGICAPLREAGRFLQQCGRRFSYFTACSSPGDVCFSFKSDDQATADAFGTCIPKARCLALATALPGGGLCRDGAGNTL